MLTRSATSNWLTSATYVELKPTKHSRITILRKMVIFGWSWLNLRAWLSRIRASSNAYKEWGEMIVHVTPFRMQASISCGISSSSIRFCKFCNIKLDCLLFAKNVLPSSRKDPKLAWKLSTQCAEIVLLSWEQTWWVLLSECLTFLQALIALSQCTQKSSQMTDNAL